MLLAAAATLSAQSVGMPPLTSPTLPVRMGEGTGAVSGVVTDASTGKPLGGAQVSLRVEVRGPATTLRAPDLASMTTDEKGRFLFRGLPRSSDYYLNASMWGYFDGGFGKQPSRAAYAHVSVSDGEWFSKADISLSRPGAIEGTVTDERGDPMVGAMVRTFRRILVAGQPHLSAAALTTTDDRGMYRVAGLPPGQYFVAVPSVQMAVPTSVALPAPPPNNPLRPGANTVADASFNIDSKTRLAMSAYVPPVPQPGRAYQTTFYPNASSAPHATPVVLDYGRDATAVDIRMDLVPTFRLSGRIDGPRDTASALTLRLLAAGSEELGLGGEAATARVAPDATFTFVNIPSGSYTVEASSSLTQFESDGGSLRYSLPVPPGVSFSSGSAMDIKSGPPGTGVTTMGGSEGDRFWGRAEVAVVDRDVNDVVLMLRPSISISGRVEFMGQAQPPANVFIFVEPANGNPAMGQPRNTRRTTAADPAFAIDGLRAGAYVFRVLGAGDLWTLQSLTVDGRDYARTPFDASLGHDFANVVARFTDRIATVKGSVTTADGRPVASAAVVAFPAESDQWTNYGFTPIRLKSVGIDTSGGYRVDGLPAGDYILIAIDSSQADAWQDPQFLEAASRAGTRVKLGWGDSATQDLRLTVIK